ncbi:MAG: MerR family transcriptional regulator [Mycobacteriales bacterium]
MSNAGLLTVGQVMKQTGLSRKALRLYEQAELVVPVTRTDAGYRLYEPAALPRLDLIRRARALDVSISELGELLDIAEGRSDHAEENLLSIVTQKLQETATRIAELRALEQLLVNVQDRLAHPAPAAVEPVYRCGSLLCTCPVHGTSRRGGEKMTSIEKDEQNTATASGCGCGCATDTAGGEKAATASGCGCGCATDTEAGNKATQPTKDGSCGCGCGN